MPCLVPFPDASFVPVRLDAGPDVVRVAASDDVPDEEGLPDEDRDAEGPDVEPRGAGPEDATGWTGPAPDSAGVPAGRPAPSRLLRWSDGVVRPAWTEGSCSGLLLVMVLPGRW